MTLNDAIKQAEKFTEGATFHAGSQGWKMVMATLLTEVKKNDNPAAQDPCRCHACQCSESPQGPLPAYILADTADQLADQLADFAWEVDIYNGLKHDGVVKLAKHFSTYMQNFAKRLREETNDQG